MRAIAAFLFLWILVGAAACTRSGDPGAPPSQSSATPLAGSAPVPPAIGAIAPGAPVIDFLAPDAPCAFGHRGFVLDLGDATMRARMNPQKLVVPDVETREHEGATWAAIHDRSLELSFVSPAEIRPEGGVIVEARVRGGVAKSAAVYLDGKSIGQLTFAKGEAKVVSARAPNGSIARGANELQLRFSGGARSGRDNLAEIDWIRVGPYDSDAPYAAPTRGDAIATVSIGGTARRGLSLRAPGFARCSSFVPSGAVVEGWIGASGGEADAEVRVLVDRGEPRVVGSFHLGGEGAPAWRPISLPLGETNTIASVELVAKSSTKGARVVFAEARVVAAPPPPPAPQPKSKGVIVVVLGTTPPKMLAPWGGAIPTPELAQLATGGMVFDAHRATTSWAHGSVASMLTGLPAREHGVTDGDASLGPTAITIAEAARQAGVVTAMFTGNPTTSAPFGFSRGWETFTARLPNEEGVAATAPFDDASKWLETHKDDRFLVVIHARGGHPPWDVASEELKDLPPTGYAGSLEPKHGGEGLGKARHAGAARPLTDADRERAFALHAKGVAQHDAALGRLVAQLRTLGRDTDTTIIVTGDVGVDAAAHVPFLDDDSLDEASLAIPLVVHAPGTPTRARILVPTSGVDVARTALDALGLGAPREMRGESLFATAQRTAQVPERASLATTATRFSARWGGFVLVGAREREAKLCNLSLEPDCVSDVRATHPIAAEVMHGLVFDELTGKKATPAPRAAIDAPTAAALRAWGR